MSDPQTDPPAEGGKAQDIDFERAEYVSRAPASVGCHTCGQPITRDYYGVNGKSTCDGCVVGVREEMKGSVFKALLRGTLAGAVGAAVYYAIRTVTGYDLALITIVVGVMVGMAVRSGAGHSSRIGYRILAVLITYVAMCMTYVPEVLSAMASDAEGGEGGAARFVVSVVVAGVFSLAVPPLLVVEMEVLAVIIFGFGLWEAWKLSAPQPLLGIEGPFAWEDAAQAQAGSAALPESDELAREPSPSQSAPAD